jgi:hypothetical protein
MLSGASSRFGSGFTGLEGIMNRIRRYKFRFKLLFFKEGIWYHAK